MPGEDSHPVEPILLAMLTGHDMWVTRALKKMQIAHLFVGISVREVSRLKGGVYSFLTVYNTSYVVKKTAEI